MARRRQEKPPVQSLTVFLLKTATSRYEDALDDPDSLTRYGVKPSVGFEGALYLAPQKTATPRWLKFLQTGTRGDLEELYNASTSAVLFVRASRRVFAIVFGYGRSLLKPERIERSFGFRVVLNAVDENGLRSVDTKTVQELTVHTRRQTSRRSRLSDFGVDREEDILGAVVGVPRNPGFGSVISGFDALKLKVSVEFEDFEALCREILRTYRKTEYRNRGFAFVDHVRGVADPDLKEKLDTRIVDALMEERFDGIHMAPPEVVDWSAIEGFSFIASAEPEPDLELESFITQIRRSEKLSVERFKRQRVFIHLSNSAEPQPGWSVYQVLVVELEYRGRRYVLSGGEWYEVDQTFARAITNKVSRMKGAGLGLPPAYAGENERAYNERVAERRGIYLMDRKLARLENDPIELCDLYSSRKMFIHVKRWKASSTLSHLFAQGKVSAEAFLFDDGYRREARDHMREVAPSLETHVPVGRPDPGKYTIVMAIIKGGGRGWKRTLPFFSQLHLARSAEHLRRLGFEVRLERIAVSEE